MTTNLNGRLVLNSHWCCICTWTVFVLELDDNKPEWMVDSEPWYHQHLTALTPISHWNLANIWQISPITCEKEKSRCTSSHTGTSASSPMAAGIIALVLEVILVFIWQIHQYITTLTPISCQYLGLFSSYWRICFHFLTLFGHVRTNPCGPFLSPNMIGVYIFHKL